MVNVSTIPMGAAIPWIIHQDCGAEDHQGLSFGQPLSLVPIPLGIHLKKFHGNNQPGLQSKHFDLNAD
jgi:hypothetical protein